MYMYVCMIEPPTSNTSEPTRPSVAGDPAGQLVRISTQIAPGHDPQQDPQRRQAQQRRKHQAGQPNQHQPDSDPTAALLIDR